jgi:hypothetical protein
MSIFGRSKTEAAPAIVPVSQTPEMVALQKTGDQIREQIKRTQAALDDARSRPAFNIEAEAEAALRGELLPEVGARPPAPTIEALAARLKALELAEQKLDEQVRELGRTLSIRLAQDQAVAGHHRGLIADICQAAVGLMAAMDQERAFAAQIEAAGYSEAPHGSAVVLALLGTFADEHSVISQWAVALGKDGLWPATADLSAWPRLVEVIRTAKRRAG